MYTLESNLPLLCTGCHLGSEARVRQPCPLHVDMGFVLAGPWQQLYQELRAQCLVVVWLVRFQSAQNCP